MKTYFALLGLFLFCSCGSTSFKPYDRTKIAKGFTQTEDSIADAKKYTQDAKNEVRGIKSNSKLIDNKTNVILRNWDRAK